MKITTDDLGTRVLSYGETEHELKIKWSTNDLVGVMFCITAFAINSTVTLSLEGLRAVVDENGVRFSNPDKQFLQNITIPKPVADVLCEELRVEYVEDE